MSFEINNDALRIAIGSAPINQAYNVGDVSILDYIAVVQLADCIKKLWHSRKQEVGVLGLDQEKETRSWCFHLVNPLQVFFSD